MRKTMPRKRSWLRDFATIFAHAWYRDFPIQPPIRPKAQRADWTIHMGLAVRSTADLMGLFTHFESGVRTDAILRDRQRKPIAALEWEWLRLHNEHAKELAKLKHLSQDIEFTRLRFAGLISYSREDEARTDLAHISSQWQGAAVPLLLVVIHFRWKGKDRIFSCMTFHKIREGAATLLREQPTYPWDVKGSRWEQEQALE